jgi:hypothetical protein
MHNFAYKETIHQIVAGRQTEILAALGVRLPAHPTQRINCPYPDHQDRHPSWRWDNSQGKAFCTCGHGNIFHVVAKMRGLPSGRAGFPQAADYCREVLGAEPWPERAQRPDSQPKKPSPREHRPPPKGCTLAGYADLKKLPMEFLLSLGIMDAECPTCPGIPAISIPYRDRDSTPMAVRFRVDLEGKDKFRWRQGDKPPLYGLDRLANHKSVAIVEGESCCQTLWHHDIPAVGLPGAGNWNEERDAATFDGLETIYVVIERDQGGEQVLKWLPKSAIRARVKLVDLGDFKDVSALYLNDPSQFGARWNAACDNAQPWQGDKAADQWPVLDRAAYHGLAGRIAKTIEPHTEADPVAILIQTLVCFGNAVGRGPFYRIEGDLHFPKLFCVLVGVTSKGRKGTSFGRVRQIMALAELIWEQYRIQTGLASGEGLIFHVRDPITKINKDGLEEEVDSGVPDKRLLLQVEEFASALAVMERPGNILSPVIRDAWGPGFLQTMTKNSPTRATGSHISIVGHVTEQELRSALTRVEMGNGFANRFLFVKVRRSKFLPHGGGLSDQAIAELGAATKVAIESAQKIGRVRMTDEAAKAWELIYPQLSADRPGLLGAVTGRAEAQVIRLALVYALLDNTDKIDVAHLKAGIAIWEYCEESARQIFGDSLGDPVADTILEALRRAGASGMPRTAISDLFGRNQSSAGIRVALGLLSKLGKARSETRETGKAGRPIEMWYAT